MTTSDVDAPYVLSRAITAAPWSMLTIGDALLTLAGGGGRSRVPKESSDVEGH
jgi:hypothetical protein